jgi:hypothetical protein
VVIADGANVTAFMTAFTFCISQVDVQSFCKKSAAKLLLVKQAYARKLINFLQTRFHPGRAFGGDCDYRHLDGVNFAGRAVGTRIRSQASLPK